MGQRFFSRNVHKETNELKAHSRRIGYVYFCSVAAMDFTHSFGGKGLTFSPYLSLLQLLKWI